MDNPKLEVITPFEKPKEENKIITRYKNLINNIKESFSSGISKIGEDILKSYQIYLDGFFQKLDEYCVLIENHNGSEEFKKECYEQMSLLLKQILEDKGKSCNNYFHDVSKLSNQLLDSLIRDNLPRGEDFMKKMIQMQINEREMKNKRKSKIIINGENENENGSICANLNYEKIVITKMKKEKFELLFAQLSPYSKFYNKNYNTPERSGSTYSISGEPAPFIVNQEINQTNFQENVNNKQISDISIKDSYLEEINFVDYFPYIDNLKIINTKLSYNINEKINFPKLETLKLEGVGLINENANPLFEQIRKNDIMRKNLRILSFKNNNITFLDYKKGYADNILKAMSFITLEILDMSYNKLYLFQNQIFNSLDNIKLIDLTNNNITFPTNLTDLLKAAKSKKCLVLMTNNLAILKEKANIEYNEYLYQIFKELNYPLKNITLENIFCNNNYPYIFNIEIGKLENALVYLNLSSGQLKDKDLFMLLSEKWNFPNLKYFILESNYLTEQFLYALIKKEYNFGQKLSNLKHLNLSDNQIGCTDVDKFKQFLELFKNMEILELKYTPVEKYINQVLKKKVIKYHDQKNQRIQEHAFNNEEKKIDQIIENNYLKEKTKLTIKIFDYINTKYTKTILTHFPHLLERIDMENKFPV